MIPSLMWLCTKVWGTSLQGDRPHSCMWKLQISVYIYIYLFYLPKIGDWYQWRESLQMETIMETTCVFDGLVAKNTRRAGSFEVKKWSSPNDLSIKLSFQGMVLQQPNPSHQSAFLRKENILNPIPFNNTHEEQEAIFGMVPVSTYRPLMQGTPWVCWYC